MVFTSYGNRAEREGERAALLVDVGAEPADARHADREVRLLLFGELLHLPRRHDLLGQVLEVLGLERRHLAARCSSPLTRMVGRPAHLELQVGAAALDHLRDGLLEVERGGAARPRRRWRSAIGIHPEEDLAEFDRLRVLDADLADHARELGLDFVHDLHCLDDADRLARGDPRARPSHTDRRPAPARRRRCPPSAT